jgi:hypothetical protein
MGLAKYHPTADEFIAAINIPVTMDGPVEYAVWNDGRADVLAFLTAY